MNWPPASCCEAQSVQRHGLASPWVERDTAWAMSEENVEFVRRAMDAWNRRDWAAATDMGTSETEVHWEEGRPLPDVPPHSYGATAIVDAFKRIADPWDKARMDPIEFIEAPDGRLVVVTRFSAKGKESGAPVTFHYFAIWTVRDGKAYEIAVFAHRAEALEAAGLWE
jgi:ketosteroid isomerase-like protein